MYYCSSVSEIVVFEEFTDFPLVVFNVVCAPTLKAKFLSLCLQCLDGVL